MKHRAALLVAAGAVVGWLLPAEPPALAEVRRTAPTQPFQSGAQRSEVVLREIATTLRAIDGRLARLEKTVQKIGARSGGAHVP